MINKPKTPVSESTAMSFIPRQYSRDFLSTLSSNSLFQNPISKKQPEFKNPHIRPQSCFGKYTVIWLNICNCVRFIIYEKGFNVLCFVSVVFLGQYFRITSIYIAF